MATTVPATTDVCVDVTASAIGVDTRTAVAARASSVWATLADTDLAVVTSATPGGPR